MLFNNKSFDSVIYSKNHFLCCFQSYRAKSQSITGYNHNLIVLQINWPLIWAQNLIASNEPIVSFHLCHTFHLMIDCWEYLLRGIGPVIEPVIEPIDRMPNITQLDLLFSFCYLTYNRKVFRVQKCLKQFQCSVRSVNVVCNCL